MRQAELLGCPDLFKINADNNRIRELDVVRSLDRARLLSSSPHLTSSSSPLTSFRLLPSHLLSSRLVPSPLLSSSSPLFSHLLSSPIPSAAIPTKPRLAQPVARAQEYLAQMTSLRKLYLANNELPDAPGIGAALIRSELVPPPPLSPPLLSSHLTSFPPPPPPPPLFLSPHFTSSHLTSPPPLLLLLSSPLLTSPPLTSSRCMCGLDRAGCSQTYRPSTSRTTTARTPHLRLRSAPTAGRRRRRSWLSPSRCWIWVALQMFII